MIVRFNSRRNPTPASFTHNTRIEIAWTLIPVVILIVIGSFSLPILFKQLNGPDARPTVKATGNQWYWSYNYPANDVTFDSLMLRQDDSRRYGYPPEMLPARRRHRAGGAGGQGGARAGGRRRRDPFDLDAEGGHR